MHHTLSLPLPIISSLSSPPFPPTKKMSTQVAKKFSNFFEKWMSQLEDLLHLLQILFHSKVINPREGAHTTMIKKLTSHHKEFYKFKWDLAHEDILSFYSPIWLTPLENAQLWFTGWKPSTAFGLVEGLKQIGSAELTEEQGKKIKGLKARVKVDEDRVEKEMERIQVATADQKTVELMRLEEQVKWGGGVEAVKKVGEEVDRAVKEWLEGLKRVMKKADCVRLMTLKELLEILSPVQGVSFLGAKANNDVRVRFEGKLLMGN